MRFALRHALIASLLGAFATLGWAQGAFPAHPITLIIPFPAGGVVDNVGRLVGQSMTKTLGVTVIVENKPGAGGTLGAALVAKAKPDGYTLLVGGSATQVFGPALYKNLPYDARRDFVPIGQISSGPLVLVVGSNVPSTDVPGLVSYLKTEGSHASYASNGNGTFPHLAAELFKQANHLSTTHIPYSGGPAAIIALIRGEVAFSINHIPVVQSMVKSGKIRALATTGSARSVVFPDIPTLEEVGMKGFDANAWWGLFAPAGTPADVVSKVNGALAVALKDPAVRAALAAQGDEAQYSSAKDFSIYVEAETQKWTKVVKTADLKIE